jgi:hypothetical protein
MRTCKQCQKPLPQNAPEGLCPECLARVALGSEPPASGATINVNPLAEAAQGKRVPPDVSQLAAQFPSWKSSNCSEWAAWDRLYREIHGSSLAHAKAAVEKLAGEKKQ